MQCLYILAQQQTGIAALPSPPNALFVSENKKDLQSYFLVYDSFMNLEASDLAVLRSEAVPAQISVRAHRVTENNAYHVFHEYLEGQRFTASCYRMRLLPRGSVLTSRGTSGPLPN